MFHRDAPSPANKRALMFAGFVEIAVSTMNERVLVGERPKWKCGASATFRHPIGSPGKNLGTAAAVTLSVKGVSSVTNGDSRAPPAEKKTWKLVMDDDDGGVFGDDGGGDDDLVDEDSLLENSAPVKRNSEQVKLQRVLIKCFRGRKVLSFVSRMLVAVAMDDFMSTIYLENDESLSFYIFLLVVRPIVFEASMNYV